MSYDIPRFDIFNTVSSLTVEDAGPFIWIVFGIIVFLFVIYSAILIYHWLKYGLGKRAMKLVIPSYFLVSFLLILTLAYASWQITG